MKPFLSTVLAIIFHLIIFNSSAQECSTRQLNPQVAGFLKMIEYKD